MVTDSLRTAAETALQRARSADGSTLNEANTKALLIEPMLMALGWDMYDLEAVTREYRVYDGTFLDYALLVSKRPALFCEAKPTRMALDDPKWVSQTINYANNEGVVWCVLTDGIRWRVFKANEAAPMEKKLAFEVSLNDLFDPQSAARAEALFHCLTPGAVAEGELARLGTQVFVDSRVQDVLSELLEEPPAKLVDLVRGQLGDGHGLKPADVRGALARVVGPAVDALKAANVDVTPPRRLESQPAHNTSGRAKPAGGEAPKSQETGARDEGARAHFGATLADLVNAGALTPGPLTSTNGAWPASAELTAAGTIRYDGQEHSSPSTAASAVKGGGAVNGWVFWARKTPSGVLTLADARSRYIAAQKR
jgi:hypothetical protein